MHKSNANNKMVVEKKELELIKKKVYQGFYTDLCDLVNRNYGSSYTQQGIRQHLNKHLNTKRNTANQIRIPDFIIIEARKLLKYEPVMYYTKSKQKQSK